MPLAAQTPDQSIIQAITDLDWVTTGRAPEVEVFRITIADTAEKDEWPTILTKLTLHGECVNAPNYTGADFSWRLLSEDTDGQRSPESFHCTEAPGSGVTFQLVFEARTLLHVPSGESRSLTVLARYEGTVSGEFPSTGFNPANPRAIYFTADLDNGDFETTTEVESSRMSEGGEGPELGPIQLKVEQPALTLIEDWPSTIRMDDTLSAILEVRDRYGNLLTGNTETPTMTANWFTSYFENVPLVTAIGPVNGRFTFDLHPPEEGEIEAFDNRIGFTNHARVPGGNIRVRFDVPGGGFPIVDGFVSLKTDENSTFEEVDLPQTFEAANGFQLVASFALVDSGELDMLPTVISRLILNVRVGDNCPFNATDFHWQLHTDGLIFTPAIVQPLFVQFQSMFRFSNSDLSNPLPPNYLRSNPNFEPLLLAQEGTSSPFAIYASTEIDNAALEGQEIQLYLSTNSTVPFVLSGSSDSRLLLGSVLTPGFALPRTTFPTITIASPTLPKEPCIEPGEGEGEGEACLRGPVHSADQDSGNSIGLNELLRVIQFFNSSGLGCQADTEDGYAPNNLSQSCCPHDSDYIGGPSWSIDLSELLRLIQFFNSGGYTHCPENGTEDGYCPGP